jgi:hypothetical protein
MDEPLPFDTIALDGRDGGPRLSVAEFHSLSFQVRVRAILGGKLRFWLRDEPVNPHVGLRALRERNAAQQPVANDTTSRGIIVQWRDARLLEVRFTRQVDDAECARYLQELDGVLRRGRPYATLCVQRGPWRLPATQRSMQTEFMRTRKKDLARLCMGIGFVLPHALPRLVLTGILLIQPLPTRHAVFDTEDAALDWLGRL